VSRITPSQTNFNGGEISARLRGRTELNIYDIALDALTGWVPLPEGGLEACPGLIQVAPAKGPCRLIPFDYNATQGYVIEMSAGTARFYTNDARIEDEGAPIELAIPYDKPAIDALMWEQSYDVLYLFHRAYQTRQLVRSAADSFVLSPLAFTDGPFEDRNKDEALFVYASGVDGDVTLHAQRGGAPEALFAVGDIGGLFQIEVDDFGSISSWEPTITVTPGQYLTSNERVYRVVGGATRTGTVAPIHNAGVEWDGIGKGKDINDKDAGGVQLEYVCNRLGILRITGFTDSATVTATVLKRLPFTATNNNYTYTGGYYDRAWGAYTPPHGAVVYQYGSWRWRFGAFSTRRGWPSSGIIWNQRLVLAKDDRLYGSVVGDLQSHATYNELGEVSTDQAFVVRIDDANPIVAMMTGERLLVMTASGMFSVGPSNAAQGVGPGNIKSVRQNNEGAAPRPTVMLDGRPIYISKNRRRVIEADYSAQRDRIGANDLTRYARHMGGARFTDIVSARDPNRLLWALRGDGSLACAAYLPEEQVLGWSNRPLASGVAARSIASITDPLGEHHQLWVAVQIGSDWHVTRMDQFRQEGDAIDPVMTDMAVQYQGAPATTFGPVPWFADRVIDVQADGALYLDLPCTSDGHFTLPVAASYVDAGLKADCMLRTLPNSKGSDNGATLGKMQRISRLTIDVWEARALQVQVQGCDPIDLEQLRTTSLTERGFERDTGPIVIEDTGNLDRLGQIIVRRIGPAAATLRAICPTIEVQQR